MAPRGVTISRRYRGGRAYRLCIYFAAHERLNGDRRYSGLVADSRRHTDLRHDCTSCHHPAGGFKKKLSSVRSLDSAEAAAKGAAASNDADAAANFA